MGTPSLLFQRHLTSDKILSGPSVGVLPSDTPEKDADNIGGLLPRVSGSPTSETTYAAELTADGDVGVATFKWQIGASWYGRKATSTWDNGAGGTALTIRIGASSQIASPVVFLDTDGDGIDNLAIAAVLVGGTQIDIISSTDLTLKTGSWATRASDVTGSETPRTLSRVSLVRRGTEVLLVYVRNDNVVMCRRSADHGVTFGDAYEVATAASTYGNTGACVLPTGKVAVVYNLSGGIYVKTSSDLLTWSSAVEVTTAANNDPACAVGLDGIFRVWCSSVLMRYTEAADPGDSATAFSSETLTTATAGKASMCVATDGTIYLVQDSGASDSIVWTARNPVTGSWTASATLADGTPVYSYPAIACCGGALICLYLDETSLSVLARISKYITTWATGTDSWTGLGAQYLGEGIWMRWEGGAGYKGDGWTWSSFAMFGPENMISLVPGRITKNASHSSDLDVVFDLGANELMPIDLICLAGNFRSCAVEFNDTNVWTSPQFSENLDLGVNISGNYTGSKAKLSPTGVPFAYRAIGHTLHTDNAAFEICEQSVEYVWCYGQSLDGSPRGVSFGKAWTRPLARREKRYMRVHVVARTGNKTVDGDFRIRAFAAGVEVALPNARVIETSEQAVKFTSLLSGEKVATVNGRPLRTFSLVFTLEDADKKDEIVNRIQYNDTGAVPFILIPDGDNPHDFAVVIPASTKIATNPDQFTLELQEIL